LAKHTAQPLTIDNPQADDLFHSRFASGGFQGERMTGNLFHKVQRQAMCGAWLILVAVVPALHGADDPYFVTYSHHLEEPGNLEISISNAVGRPDGGQRFLNTLTEFEYGLKGWWTTELYLHGQTQGQDSTVFTGYRWENRFRLLPREHWINPVLYVEFENINGADRSFREVVGFDGQEDLLESNAEARREKKRELEAKLILGSNFRGWNLSENFVAEKNVGHAPFEFGYAVGLSRPLALAARPEPCRFCPENFRAGVEVYGALGTHEHFGLAGGTSHYVAPTLAWELASGTTLQISPGFGVTQSSLPFLLRFGVSYEISQFGRTVGRMFH
jgi:hypothetical protein